MLPDEPERLNANPPVPEIVPFRMSGTATGARTPPNELVTRFRVRVNGVVPVYWRPIPFGEALFVGSPNVTAPPAAPSWASFENATTPPLIVSPPANVLV